MYCVASATRVATRALTLLVAVLALAGCSSSGKPTAVKVQHYQVSDQPAPPDQQVLRRRIQASPNTLDPQQLNSLAARRVVTDLFEGLTTNTADGKVVPGVASSWDIGKDGLSYTFHLRPDARWSNGQPLTAGDFVYAWRREFDPRTASTTAQYVDFIVNADAILAGSKPPSSLGVSAPDPHTFVVHLSRPVPDFLNAVSGEPLYPLYAPAIKQWGDSWVRPGHMVNNGPFKLETWVINGHLSVVKNPYYWDAGHVRLEKVIYYPISKTDAALNRYMAGNLDLVDHRAFPTTDVTWLRPMLGNQVRIYPGYGMYFVGMLLNKKPFDNRKLRLALTMSLDRKILVDKLLRGTSRAAYSMFPPSAGFDQQMPEWASWPMAKRLEVARRLYREAGYSKQHPLKVKLLFGAGGVEQNNVMEAEATMWRQALGAQITPTAEEFKVMVQDVQSKNAVMFEFGYSGGSPTPYIWGQMFMKGNGQNNSGYDNPAYDALVKKAMVEMDTPKRYAMLEEANRILNRDLPVIPLYYPSFSELVKPYVAGFAPNIYGSHPARYMWIRKYTVKKP